MDTKSRLHPRNKNRFPYQFDELIQGTPELAEFRHINKYGVESIDFANPNAVVCLNRALLKRFYGIAEWFIPQGYLCPPVPGRADYIHYLADLLAEDHQGKIPRGKQVRVLDIGTGANIIYPLIGFSEYKWRFTAVDIDEMAIKNAMEILHKNGFKKNEIEIRFQPDKQLMFRGVIKPKEFYEATLCNPPFHDSPEQAFRGSKRKWKNVGKGRISDDTLNFGGQSNELWCEGGELRFIKTMMMESREFAFQVRWFTGLVSKKANLPELYKTLYQIEAKRVRTIEMRQGQKTSRMVAWSFV